MAVRGGRCSIGISLHGLRDTSGMSQGVDLIWGRRRLYEYGLRLAFSSLKADVMFGLGWSGWGDTTTRSIIEFGTRWKNTKYTAPRGGNEFCFLVSQLVGPGALQLIT